LGCYIAVTTLIAALLQRFVSLRFDNTTIDDTDSVGSEENECCFVCGTAGAVQPLGPRQYRACRSGHVNRAQYKKENVHPPVSKGEARNDRGHSVGAAGAESRKTNKVYARKNATDQQPRRAGKESRPDR